MERRARSHCCAHGALLSWDMHAQIRTGEVHVPELLNDKRPGKVERRLRGQRGLVPLPRRARGRHSAAGVRAAHFEEEHSALHDRCEAIAAARAGILRGEGGTLSAGDVWVRCRSELRSCLYACKREQSGKVGRPLTLTTSVAFFATETGPATGRSVAASQTTGPLRDVNGQLERAQGAQ